MHPDTFNNWMKIKQTFEESGNIDNMYYVRACAIVEGKPDPIDAYFKKGKVEEEKR